MFRQLYHSKSYEFHHVGVEHFSLILWAHTHRAVYFIHIILYAESPDKCISRCGCYKTNHLQVAFN